MIFLFILYIQYTYVHMYFEKEHITEECLRFWPFKSKHGKFLQVELLFYTQDNVQLKPRNAENL